MAQNKDFAMDDFEATVVAQDTIRLDLYNDDIEGETRGRYTEVVSVSQAMSMVIVLVQEIRQCEIIEAQSKKGKRK